MLKRRGKNSKERIAKYGSEGEFLAKCYEDSTKCCAVCGDYIPSFHVSSCAHILSKKNYPTYRYNPDNIMIVCPFYKGTKDCHGRVDSMSAGCKYYIEKIIVREVSPSFEQIEFLHNSTVYEIEREYRDLFNS